LIEKRKIKRTAEHASNLERPLKVSSSGFSKDVDGDRLGVVQVLDAHESLDEERLGELEVDVHDGHHGDSHVRGAELVGNIKPQATKKERMTYEFGGL